MKQIVIARAYGSGPEGHHLHVAARADMRHGIFPEAALHLDQTQHHVRIQSGTGRLVMHRTEEVFTIVLVRHPFGQTLRHLAQPGFPFLTRGEHRTGNGLIGHGALQYRLHTGGKTLFCLRSGVGEGGKAEADGED